MLNGKLVGRSEKIVLCLMALFILFGFTCCSAPDLRPAAIPDSSTPPIDETAALEAESTQAAQEETEIPPADPDTVFYFSNALETGRIYRQGLDGSGLVLICDVEASNVTEMGDILYFISKDALCRCPAVGGLSAAVIP